MKDKFQLGGSAHFSFQHSGGRGKQVSEFEVRLVYTEKSSLKKKKCIEKNEGER